MTDRILAPVPDPDDNSLVLPHDNNAERAVLGSMLANPRPDDADLCLDTVTGIEFHKPAHGHIFDAIATLRLSGQPLDPISVANHLTTHGVIRRAGGAAYLHELALAAPVSSTAPYYADIIANLAARRRLIEHARRLETLGYNTTGTPVHELYARAEADLERTTAKLHHNPNQPASSWEPADLAAIRATGLARPQATLLTTNLGQGLLYPGRTHSIAGESTTGKTWVALAGLCQEVAAGHPVTFIDFEDRADSLLTRLEDMGADPDAVDRLVRYVGPDKALDAATWRHVEAATKDCRITIIDGVTEAMTMHGWSLLDNEDIARWYDLLPRRIASLGPAVLEIDHVVKNKDDRGRYAIGGAHKLNGITGCAYNIHTTRSFSIGTPGSSRITVAKDRHGTIGPVGHTAAEFHVTPDITRHREAIVWELTPNNTTYTNSGRPRLTGYMEKISRFIEQSPGTNKRGILDVVKGKEAHLSSAIATLLEEGFIRTEPGERNAVLHYSITPYRQGEDPHA